MLEKLKEEVYEANMQLPKQGLVTLNCGTVSGIDRTNGLFVIKPSGVGYGQLTPDDMVVMDLDGRKVEGCLDPSSDTRTHLVLYNHFIKLGGVVHTHSTWAASWAQAGRDIPCYGAAHADYMDGPVPCTRNLYETELKNAEENTGKLIVDLVRDRQIDYLSVPGVLCKGHGAFIWGENAGTAVRNAVMLEEIAKMAALCELINPTVKPIPQYLLDKNAAKDIGTLTIKFMDEELRLSILNEDEQ